VNLTTGKTGTISQSVEDTTSLDVATIRKDFPQLSRQVRDKPLTYLDNAATSQKPRVVINKINEYYQQYNANIHRAIYAIGEQATLEYESAREKVARFINAWETSSVIFTRGTTEAINLVAYSWGRHNLGPGDEILITEMEHHSNIIPWQLAARDTGATLRYIPIRSDGTLALNNPDEYFTDKTRLVSFIHQSNVFGTINPVREIYQMAKDVGALVLVDAAQSVPHSPMDIQTLGCDFLAFSGHKMLGPTGVGVLCGRQELLTGMEPFLGGGEMINSVTMEESTWNKPPWKFEAGTPNIAQVIGLGAAVDYLETIGIDSIERHERTLTRYALEALSAIPEVTIYGPGAERGGLVSFNVENVHPHDLAQVLDERGIAIRAGHHCAQPIMQKLDVPATARASFYLYNTTVEIDALCEGVTAAIDFMT
jgi:cysteine desulfurase/selenocysteine lyase|tara:strand:- start:901 stop:2175 length:1275 start_codon:yes stop_codon:yes gene_type:complete